MLAKLLRLIARPFIGTGIGNYLPWLHRIYEYLYASQKPKLVRTKLKSGQSIDVWSDDTGIGIFLLTTGEYEPFETQLLMGDLKPDSVFMEVGANSGYYTLLAAQRAKQVIAVEPDRDLTGLLKGNIELNNLKNVAVAEFAFGEKAGVANFKSNQHHRGKSGLTIEGSFDYSVEIVTLDKVASNWEHKPDVILADIEGAEFNFLLGGQDFIHSHHPILYLEYNPPALSDLGHEPKDFIKLLLSWGYQIEIIVEQRRQLINYNEDSLDQVINQYGYTNLRAIK